MMCRLAILCALLSASIAHASISNCVGVGDGTSCTTACISNGSCFAGDCIPGILRADGSPCSSEDKCTANDTCQGGVCTTGSALLCPSLNSCERGSCLSSIGCVLVNICKPDFAMPPQPDMTMMTKSDGGQTDGGHNDQGVFDQGYTDLNFPNPDMCYTPPHASFDVCHGDGGAVIVPFDMTANDAHVQDLAGDMVSRYGHVRGSRPGDCSFTPARRSGNVGAGLLPFGLLLGLLALRRRARA